MSSPLMAAFTPHQSGTPGKSTPTKASDVTSKENPAKTVAVKQLQQNNMELNARIKQLEAVNKHMIKSVDDVASKSFEMETKAREYSQQNKALQAQNKSLEEALVAQTEAATLDREQCIEKGAKRSAELLSLTEDLMKEKEVLHASLAASTETASLQENKENAELKEANNLLTEKVQSYAVAIKELNDRSKEMDKAMEEAILDKQAKVNEITEVRREAAQHTQDLHDELKDLWTSNNGLVEGKARIFEEKVVLQAKLDKMSNDFEKAQTACDEMGSINSCLEEDLKTKLAKMENTIETLKAEKAELEGEVAIGKEVSEGLVSESTETEMRIDGYRTTIAKLEQDNAALEAEKQSVAGEIEAAVKTANDETLNEIEKLKAELAEMTRKNESLGENQGSHAEEMNALRASAEELQSKNDDFYLEKMALSKTCDEQSTRLERLNEEAEKMKTELAEAKTAQADVDANKPSMETELELLRSAKTNAECSHLGLMADYEKLQKAYDVLQVEVEELNSELETSKSNAETASVSAEQLQEMKQCKVQAEKLQAENQVLHAQVQAQIEAQEQPVANLERTQHQLDMTNLKLELETLKRCHAEAASAITMPVAPVVMRIPSPVKTLQAPRVVAAPVAPMVVAAHVMEAAPESAPVADPVPIESEADDELQPREPPAEMTAREKMNFRKQEKQRIQDLKIKMAHKAALDQQAKDRATCQEKIHQELHGKN